jgi:predicted transposase/invertase (TIGR01784 family)
MELFLLISNKTYERRSMEYSTDKFYSCKYDRAFKEVFLKERNKDLLKVLLESILKLKIKGIKLIPNELNEENLLVRRKTLDALIETDIGKIGIEVNSNNRPYVHLRNMAYICDLYASYTLSGEKYTDKVDIIQINLSYELGINHKKLSIYKIMDDEENLYVNNFKIYEINMDYYLKLWYDKNEKEIKENEYLVMLGLDKEELEAFSKKIKNEKVEKYMSEIKKVNGKTVFKRFISYEQDKEFIKNSELSEAKDEGIKEGIKEGSYDKQIEIAKNLLNENMDIKTISKVTGLSIENINKLKIK